MNRKLANWVVIGASIVWVPLGILSTVPAGFSVMMFDAPGADKNPATIALVFGLMSFPVACLFGVAISWKALRGEKFFQACLWTYLPFVSLAIGGAGLAWIWMVQGGRFAG